MYVLPIVALPGQVILEEFERERRRRHLEPVRHVLVQERHHHHRVGCCLRTTAGTTTTTAAAPAARLAAATTVGDTIITSHNPHPLISYNPST